MGKKGVSLLKRAGKISVGLWRHGSTCATVGVCVSNSFTMYIYLFTYLFIYCIAGIMGVIKKIPIHIILVLFCLVLYRSRAHLSTNLSLLPMNCGEKGCMLKRYQVKHPCFLKRLSNYTVVVFCPKKKYQKTANAPNKCRGREQRNKISQFSKEEANLLRSQPPLNNKPINQTALIDNWDINSPLLCTIKKKTMIMACYLPGLFF